VAQLFGDPAAALARSREILQNTFGHTDFKGPQVEVLKHVFNGQATLALMPTGMGKSVCFQVPSLMLEGLTVVITPLVALMHDQVTKARSLGIQATYLSATISKEEREARLRLVTGKKIKLLYVTPERLRHSEFIAQMIGLKISFVAIDEAHCMSQWGHDFRPDYSRIKEFLAKVGQPQVLALTASAPPHVQKDIAAQLGLKLNESMALVTAGIARENLVLKVEEHFSLENKMPRLVDFLQEVQGNVLVYFSLISTLKSAANILTKLKVDHLTYHGDLRAQERKKNQNQFLEAQKSLMLATPAFGLGVDKADIRAVVHFEMPGSLEAYYQEVGRAGRDQAPSQCVLFYDEDDVSIQMDFLKWANPEADLIINVYRLIQKGHAELHTEGFQYLRKQLNFYNTRDYRAETAVNLLERWGFIEESDSGFGYVCLQEPEGDLLDKKLLAERLRESQKRLLKMVQFAKLETGCRWKELKLYFGDAEAQNCGKCDLCLNTSHIQ
jgi:ATP-dependent DNA helicase RecQ